MYINYSIDSMPRVLAEIHIHSSHLYSQHDPAIATSLLRRLLKISQLRELNARR